MVDDTLDILKSYNERMQRMPSRRAELIQEAREARHTWREIAAALDMTEHGAIKAGAVKPKGNA